MLSWFIIVKNVIIIILFVIVHEFCSDLKILIYYFKVWNTTDDILNDLRISVLVKSVTQQKKVTRKLKNVNPLHADTLSKPNEEPEELYVDHIIIPYY